jgi:hypothetical protein
MTKKNINAYDSLPTTPYRKLLDDIEKQIQYANSLAVPDSDRLEILRGALLVLIEIDPNGVTENG